jgi:hypothetical protein
MKMFFQFFAVIFLSSLFASCGPEPTTSNRKFTGMEGGGPPTMGKVAPLETIYCTVAGSNCKEWVGSGDVVIFQRQNQVYNDFLSDYATDSLTRFFRLNDWHELFPYDSRVDQNVVDKILSKEYKVQVALDSSIVIYNNNIVFTPSNVLYAIKR